MKRLQLLSVFLMLCTLSFGQNQSITGVQPFISNPIGPQFGGQEIFRFQPGLVTQLGAGSTDFGFNQKWFSIGELNTASQMVYGLRFQLPNKSLTMGYQDTNDTNPRIQWIGQGQNLGNLEFRVANSFTSTSSDLVATMRNNSSTVFAKSNFNFFSRAKVGVLADIQNGENSTNEGITVINTSNSNTNYGLYSFTTGAQNVNFALFTKVEGNQNSFNVGVYGSTVQSGGNNFAGYFDGDVVINGAFNPSDIKLKKDIIAIDSTLESLMLLQPKTYEYIKSDKINLTQGKQFGFIAQELQNVFPELVRSIRKPVINDENEVTEFFEYKSVNYIGLIAILTASIQELTAEVNELKKNKETYVVYEAAFTQEELAKIAQNGYRLEQNYPNPFQGRSSIAYALPEAENNASIMIFDMTGKTIKEYPLKEKQGQLQIDSQDFRPGIYLYSLIGNNKEIMTKRMIVK